MKRYITGKLNFILLIIIIASLVFSGCSSKFGGTVSPAAPGDIKPYKEEEPYKDSIYKPDPMSASHMESQENPDIIVSEIIEVEPKLDQLEDPNLALIDSAVSVNPPDPGEHWVLPELAALKQLVLPFFDSSSPYFMGKNQTLVFSDYLFDAKLLDDAIPVKHWETLVRSLFMFYADDKDDQHAGMYITNFDTDGFISRQAAVSGLLKMISMRYPIVMAGDYESLKPAEIISDITDCDESFETLIRMAYREGILDKTVEDTLTFRPDGLLTYSEAISTVYRVISKFGLPEIPGAEKRHPVENDTDKQNEWMRMECEDYYQKLLSMQDDKRAEILKLAEDIIIDPAGNNDLNAPLELGKWQMTLNKALGMDASEILIYTDFSGSSYLTYDIAAVSIFKLGFRINAFDCRDATKDEIDAARSIIPDFDEAFDISKFAQMAASGILRGIYEKEGFAPSSFVTRIEAMVLTKRIVENIK